MYCKKCGKLLEVDSRFCLHCGAQVEAGREIEAHTPAYSVGFQDKTCAGGEKKKKAPKRGLAIGIAIALVALLAVLAGIFLFGGSGRELAKQLDLGNRYLEEMDYEQAVIAFTNAIEIDPMSVEAHLGLVEAYIRQGDFEAALEAAQKGYDLTGDERLKEKIDMIESGEIFDSLGRVMRRTGYDENGNVAWWHIFTYNLKGQEASITAYNGAGEEMGRIDRTYDEEGRETNGYWFASESGELGLEKFTYENGLLVKYESYEDPEGSVLWDYRTYEYDAGGRESKVSYFQADGTMSTYETREYDENDQLIRRNMYRDPGDGLVLDRYQLSDYDENGNCIRAEMYGADGTLEYYNVYECDENGNTIRVETYGADGALESYLIREYDADGTYLGGKTFDGEGNLEYEE